MRFFIGIDPGNDGAIAMIGKNREVYFLEDCPPDVVLMNTLIVKLHNYCIEALAGQIIKNLFTAIERPHGRPPMGVGAGFKLGEGYGMWKGIVVGFGTSFDLPLPGEWQKGLLIKSEGKDTKAQSLAMARRLFPDQIEKLKRKKDHDRADALGIALWLRNKIMGGE